MTTKEDRCKSRPRIAILATGGTIAGAGKSSTHFTGYQPAVTHIEDLLANVPELARIAVITGEQVVQVASHDVTDDVLLLLGKRINELLQGDAVDGVVVTHGTNTLEETAYFLNLTVRSRKPIVLVGSMRPGTSMSADGPMNLFQAVVTAASPESQGRGVVLVMNNQIIGARDLVKTDTLTVDSFKAPLFGYLGYVVEDKTYFYKSACRKHTYESEFDLCGIFSLPKTAIVYGHIGDTRTAMDSFVAEGFQGIVHAGSGTAAISQAMSQGVTDAVSRGVVVVRAPRSSLGIVTRNMEYDDDRYGTVSGDTLNPPKARILLMLGLTRSNDPREIQRLFDTY